MNDIEKVLIIDEFFESSCNLTALWNKVKHYPEAKEWLEESWNDYAEDVEAVEGVPFCVALANKGVLNEES
jgi:hypothetical protein